MSNVRKDRKAVKDKARPGKKATPRKGRPAGDKDDKPDLQELLYNGGETGPFEQVQLHEAMITSLRGFLLDFDPGRFRKAVVPIPVKKDPQKFYKKFLRTLLARHPVLNKAEVRISGPNRFHSAGMRFVAQTP